MKLKLNNNEMYMLDLVHCDDLSKYITPWLWDKLRLGGNGEFLEDLVIDYLIDGRNYTNINRSPRGELWDFELKDKPECKVDVRRFGKDTIYLGNTSSNLRKTSWRNKATTLQDGGYLGVCIHQRHMGLYYLPAQLFLNSKNLESSNDFSISRLKSRFGLDIYDFGKKDVDSEINLG